jgi:hypothetical protein
MSPWPCSFIVAGADLNQQCLGHDLRYDHVLNVGVRATLF